MSLDSAVKGRRGSHIYINIYLIIFLKILHAHEQSDDENFSCTCTKRNQISYSRLSWVIIHDADAKKLNVFPVTL